MGHIVIQTPKMYDIKDAITDYVQVDTLTNRLIYATVSDNLIYNTVIAKLKSNYNTPWFVIGSVGSPAYLYEWASASLSVLFPPAFMKDMTGRVSFRGRVGGTIASAAIMFILPVGYRPSKTMLFRVIFTDGVGGYIAVNSAGEVYLDDWDGAEPTYEFQLDGINFFPG